MITLQKIYDEIIPYVVISKLSNNQSRSHEVIMDNEFVYLWHVYLPNTLNIKTIMLQFCIKENKIHRVDYIMKFQHRDDYDKNHSAIVMLNNLCEFKKYLKNYINVEEL